MTIWMLFALICLAASIPLVLWWEPWKQRGPKLTGRAEVIERRIEYKRGYHYYITFSLKGMLLEFETLRWRYDTLPEGTTGQLTYQGCYILDFIKD